MGRHSVLGLETSHYENDCMSKCLDRDSWLISLSLATFTDVLQMIVSQDVFKEEGRAAINTQRDLLGSVTLLMKVSASKNVKSFKTRTASCCNKA